MQGLEGDAGEVRLFGWYLPASKLIQKGLIVPLRAFEAFYYLYAKPVR
jgi:hypothetical protein